MPKLSSLLRAVFPPLAYCKLVNFVYPLIYKQRRGGGQTFSIEDGLLVVSWKGRRLFFVTPNRATRYIYAGGPGYTIERLRRKYQCKRKDIKIEEGEIVVDIGANIGEFSLSIAETAGQVYSFEPDPEVFRALQKNLLSYENCQSFPLALADSEGEIEFFLSTNGADSSAIVPDTYDKKITIPATTLDAFVKARNIPKLDFLKVEAEGFEPEVLNGASETLQTVRKIVVDCGPERRGEPTFDACNKILMTHGFSTIRRNNMLFGDRNQ